MARLLVVVEDPMSIRSVADTVETFLPLLIDAFVEVYIRGPRRAGLYALPRSAVRDDDNVYLFGPDSTLRIIGPNIVWRSEDTMYVDKGLNPGDKVITSSIATPIDGMELRIAARSNDTAQSPSPQPRSGQ
ncbi:MAG: hypothetical protein GF401_09545 [Chitinivibrionales bacterium]|nr:hypothetical protein [Chitinivibrionales bacterium]